MTEPRLDLEIRAHVADYVTGSESFEDFEDWILCRTWKSDDPTVRGLVSEIELPLAEFTSGHLGEEQLRERLRVLAERYFVLGLGRPDAMPGPVVERAPTETHRAPPLVLTGPGAA